MFLPHLYFQVCYALRYMATGSYYAVIRDTQGGCSRSSIGRAMSAFTRFLAANSRRHIRFPKVLITYAILLACYCFKSISHLKMHPTLSILILMLNDFLPPNKLAVYKSIESYFYNLRSQPIYQQYIKLHIIQGEALHEEAIRFSERYPMNQCVGCIDGTHVPIRRPTRNPHAFICRKGFYSLNVLVSFKPLN